MRCLLLLAAVACARPTVSASEQPIIGGENATLGDYPTVVGLIIGPGLCTGTLIAPNVVLTAAHCVRFEDLGLSTQEEVTAQTRVIFDAVSLRGGGRERRAKLTVPHPGFDLEEVGRHDVGIIVLATRITDRVPSGVLREQAGAPPGSAATLVGFGLTNPSNPSSAGNLFVVEGKETFDCETFAGMYPEGTGLSTSDLLCFNQSNGTGACGGDSGGPAFVGAGNDLIVAGVTSFGDEDCNEYGAYTRAAAEIAFIEDQMTAAEACIADGVCTPACGTGRLAADPDCLPGAIDAGTGGGSLEADAGDGGGDEGGCAVAPRGSASGWWLLLLVLGFVRRPRR